MLKWSDLGHFNFNSKWMLWGLRIFTKQTWTQRSQIGHPKSKVTSDTFCFHFVYELPNRYELPIHLQASKPNLKDCMFCIIQKIEVMQMENTSLLQFSPKKYSPYEYGASSACTECSWVFFKYFFRNGTGRCYMHGDGSIWGFHQEALIPGSDAYRRVWYSFQQWE